MINEDERKPTDPKAEVEAMGKVAEALEGLDSQAVERVLGWALASFTGSSPKGQGHLPEEPNSGAGSADLAGLFAAVSPRTGPERALVSLPRGRRNRRPEKAWTMGSGRWTFLSRVPEPEGRLPSALSRRRDLL